MPRIRCMQPFPHGTTQQVGDRIYLFVPDEQGKAIVEVEERDVAALLSIGAGYARVNDDEPSTAPQEPAGPDGDDEQPQEP